MFNRKSVRQQFDRFGRMQRKFRFKTFDLFDFLLKKCVNTSEVVRLSNITFFNFTKQIYLKHLPVIIDDATESWSAVRQLNLDRLFQMFAEDPILSQQDLCHFKSNIRQYNQIGGADRLFDDFLQGKRRSFVAHW